MRQSDTLSNISQVQLQEVCYQSNLVSLDHDRFQRIMVMINASADPREGAWIQHFPCLDNPNSVSIAFYGLFSSDTADRMVTQKNAGRPFRMLQRMVQLAEKAQSLDCLEASVLFLSGRQADGQVPQRSPAQVKSTCDFWSFIMNYWHPDRMPSLWLDDRFLAQMKGLLAQSKTDVQIALQSAQFLLSKHQHGRHAYDVSYELQGLNQLCAEIERNVAMMSFKRSMMPQRDAMAVESSVVPHGAEASVAEDVAGLSTPMPPMTPPPPSEELPCLVSDISMLSDLSLPPAMAVQAPTARVLSFREARDDAPTFDQSILHAKCM